MIQFTPIRYYAVPISSLIHYPTYIFCTPVQCPVERMQLNSVLCLSLVVFLPSLSDISSTVRIVSEIISEVFRSSRNGFSGEPFDLL